MIRLVFRVSFLLVLPLLCYLSCCSSYMLSRLVNPSRARQISWKPRAFVYEGFLTDEECDHLISLAKSELKRSAVADNLSGKSTLSDVRTSSGMFISKGKDDIISGIEDRIAAWTFLPKAWTNDRHEEMTIPIVDGTETSHTIQSGVSIRIIWNAMWHT